MSRGITVSRRRRREIMERDRYTCRYCGRSGASDSVDDYPLVEITIDHLVPAKRYPVGWWTNSMANLVCACRSCNNQKGDAMLTGCDVVPLVALFVSYLDPLIHSTIRTAIRHSSTPLRASIGELIDTKGTH